MWCWFVLDTLWCPDVLVVLAEVVLLEWWRPPLVRPIPSSVYHNSNVIWSSSFSRVSWIWVKKRKKNEGKRFLGHFAVSVWTHTVKREIVIPSGMSFFTQKEDLFSSPLKNYVLFKNWEFGVNINWYEIFRLSIKSILDLPKEFTAIWCKQMSKGILKRLWKCIQNEARSCLKPSEFFSRLRKNWVWATISNFVYLSSLNDGMYAEINDIFKSDFFISVEYLEGFRHCRTIYYAGRISHVGGCNIK